MFKSIKLLLVLQLIFISAFGQIGGGHMEKMNALIKQYGGDNNVPLKYEPQFGLVHQTILGYADHYTISDIKQIIVTKATSGATVQFNCDSTDPCINHIGSNAKGKYLSGITYYFSNEIAANTFAALAEEIIRTDFKRTTAVQYSMKEFLPRKVEAKTENSPIKTDPLPVKTETAPAKNKETSFLSIDGEDDNEGPPDEEEPVEKTRKKADHLSMNTYADEAEATDNLNPFGKQLISILQLAQRHQLAKIKGQEVGGVAQSKIKLPKAKKNYLNVYKGEDCFIAEFGTMKFYEDLEEKYLEIKDEIEASLPEEYEAKDMANSEVYENSDNEVYHTEYYHTENPSMPSIVIRIAPDGKSHTLFLRIGKP